MLKNSVGHTHLVAYHSTNGRREMGEQRVHSQLHECEDLGEERMYIQGPGLLSGHPCVFCECPHPLLDFNACFLSPLMSIILPSWSTLELFQESLFLVSP